MKHIKNNSGRQRVMLVALAIFSGLIAATSHAHLSSTTRFPTSLYFLYGQTAPCLHLFRSFPSGPYLPGATFEVVLRVESECAEVLTSFGLSESIPTGWTYVAGEALTGPTPGVVPSAGARDTLEFAWIAPPPFPLEIRYTLMVPEAQQGTVMFNGYGIYSLDTQNEQQITATVVSSVEASPEGSEGEAVPEGEVPLEGESAIEGEVALEGESANEGEQSLEGESAIEGEPPLEGESPGRVPPPGCCRPSQTGSAALPTYFSGDTLLLALAVLSLCAMKPFMR